MDDKTFIIAEAGIAHNGDLNIAKRYVDLAIDVKADAVKFQTFWHIKWLKKYELTREETIELKEYCDEKKIEFMSTPWTFEAIEFLDALTLKYKIPSPYNCNKNFLKSVAEKGKPIFLSTGNQVHHNGMATDEEIENALEVIPDANVTILHCVSKYPCLDEHFERVEQLKKFGKPVGISDHSKEVFLPEVAVIEKHIMLDDVTSIDECVSLNPKQFKKMVDYVRKREEK